MWETIMGAVVILITAVLAEEAPPKWRRVLWGLFVVAVVAQAVIQIKSHRQQDAIVAATQQAQQDTQKKLDASLLNEQYTKGQLDTINKVLGNVLTNSDPKQTAAALQGVLTTKSTLKKDTLSVCADAERWNREYLKANPFPAAADPQHATAAETNLQNTWGQKYSNAMYSRFGPRMLAILQRYAAIGVDVKMLDQQMAYGYVPQNMINTLKAFADRVNDDGTLKN
jgi:hypothetical protein